jgi:imidazolonepropionase-like amidohydrolase
MKPSHFLAITAASFILCSHAHAADSAPTLHALRAAQWLDIKSGVLRKDAVVLIEGNKIKAVGTALPIPDGVPMIDLGNRTLLPGLIDCHTHLLLRMKEDESYGNNLLTRSQATRALEGAANARATLRAGFTTVRDVENEGSGFADVALRDAIRDGLVEGPRMQVATRGVAAVGQYEPFGISPDLDHFPTGAQLISGPEEARRAVREQLGHGADIIKLYADWEHPTLTVDELKIIVEETHKQKKKVAAHATTPEGIRNAVTAGVDSVEHCEDADETTLQEMKRRGTFLVSTIAVLLDYRDTAKDDRVKQYIDNRLVIIRRTLALAHKLGVKIAGGLDAGTAALQGKNARQLSALVDLGASRLEALRSETIDAADLLGWQDRVGSLEAGKLADVIAVDGDPLSNIGVLDHVAFVMKGGEVVKSP